MLLGEYVHTLDPKKRISLPSKFRKELGKTVVVTRGFDQCLSVYSQKGWKLFSEKISELSLGRADARALGRNIFASAIEVDVDQSGRILLPQFLKDFAGLGEEAAIVGVHSRAEIWNPQKWQEYRDAAAKHADDVAEKLGEIGMV